MMEREYYENLKSVTANGDCEKCMFGCEGECHLECNKSYIDYMRELRREIRRELRKRREWEKWFDSI